MKTNPKRLVVDNSILDSLYRLELVRYLSLLYVEVLIPIGVRKEFLSERNSDADKRFSFLWRAFEEFPWMKPCQTYDSDLMAILAADRKMHEGETEVLAQRGKLERELYGPDTVVCGLDEKYARRIARSQSLSTNGTLRILAALRFPDRKKYEKDVSFLRREGKRFSNDIVGLAYRSIEKEVQAGRLLL